MAGREKLVHLRTPVPLSHGVATHYPGMHQEVEDELLVLEVSHRYTMRGDAVLTQMRSRFTQIS